MIIQDRHNWTIRATCPLIALVGRDVTPVRFCNDDENRNFQSDYESARKILVAFCPSSP